MSRRLARGPLALRATWLAMRLSEPVSRGLAGRAAVRLWFTPWRVDVGDRTRRREEAWLAGALPRQLELGGLTVNGFAVGEGPTVLLVHGWGERAARLGAFIAPLVDRGFQVVGVDAPGHGDSPDGPTDLYTTAGWIAELVDQLEVRAVVAHSIGGLATLLALRDGPPQAGSTAPLLETRTLDAVVLVAPAVRLSRVLDLFVQLFRVPPRAAGGLRQHIDQRFGADVWDDVVADRFAADIAVPALIVHDHDDPQVAVTDATELAESWPGARLVTTRGLGHVRILRDPEVVSDVTGFLAEHVRTAPTPAR